MKVVEALFIAESAGAASREQLEAAAELMAAEIKRLRGALEMIEQETLCPEAFPDTWDSYSQAEQLHITALLIAGAALEGASDQSSGSPDNETESLEPRR